MRCCNYAHTSLISSCILHSKGFEMLLTREEAEEMNKRLPEVIMYYLYSIKEELPIEMKEHLEQIFEWRKGE